LLTQKEVVARAHELDPGKKLNAPRVRKTQAGGVALFRKTS